VGQGFSRVAGWLLGVVYGRLLGVAARGLLGFAYGRLLGVVYGRLLGVAARGLVGDIDRYSFNGGIRRQLGHDQFLTSVGESGREPASSCMLIPLDVLSILWVTLPDVVQEAMDNYLFGGHMSYMFIFRNVLFHFIFIYKKYFSSFCSFLYMRIFYFSLHKRTVTSPIMLIAASKDV
jgi:hypothetical protein